MHGSGGRGCGIYGGHGLFILSIVALFVLKCPVNSELKPFTFSEKTALIEDVLLTPY